mgnify:FL=1
MTEVKKELTKDLLALSFKELIMKMPFEKITVKMITDGADVIRPTFYNHFQDKYELLEWIIMTQIIEPIGPLLQNGMVHEALVLMFTSIEKERDFYSKACKLEGQNSFESIVKSCIKQIILGVIENKVTGKKPVHAWLTPDHLAEYYSQSMCFVAISWIKSNMVIPPKEVADIYQYVIKRSLDEILSEM